MAFLDSLDIANRVCQHCGVTMISAPDEVSKTNTEITFAYDKLRRAELRRNPWVFAIKRVVLRPINPTTLLLAPQPWNQNSNYLPGSIVTDENGILWTSTSADNLNNPPASSPLWDQYFGPMTADLYDATQGYYPGELVYVPTGNPGGYVVFVSLVFNNTVDPNTASAYDASVTYGQDATVSYGGSQWRSIIVLNKGNTPTDAPADYDPAVIYVVDDKVVASDGFIYTSAISSNTGNDPVGDDGTHWTANDVPAAWDRTPVIYPAALTWVPIFASLKSMPIIYPLGTGPSYDSNTRNAFRLPAGYLRKVSQDPKAGSYSLLGGPSGLAYNDWEFEGPYLVSSRSTPIVFRFGADVTDVTKMDDMFCEGLAARIAVEVCETLTQATGKISMIAKFYVQNMGEARTMNAVEAGADEPPIDDWVSCRV